MINRLGADLPFLLFLTCAQIGEPRVRHLPEGKRECQVIGTARSRPCIVLVACFVRLPIALG